MSKWRLGAVGGAYAVLFGNFLLSLFIAATQIMPASVLTPIMADLTVSPSAAGLLVSLALLSPALLALPVGYALDRVDNRGVLLLGTVIVVGTNLWAWDAALAGAFVPLLGARFLTGVGIIMTWTAGANMVTAAFDGRNAATATGVFTASAPLGYVVGQALPPVVAGWWGWEANFPVFAIASAVSFAVFAVTAFRTASRAETDRRANFADFRRVLSSRAVWFVAAMSFVAYSLNLFFNSWMPTYLTERLGYSVAESGLLVALFPAMGVIARPSGGIVSDRVLGGRRRPVPLLSFLVTVPLVVVLWAIDAPLVVVAILVLGGFSVQLGIGIYYTYIRELVEDRVAGSAIAVLSMASFAGGFVAPVFAGWLIETTGAYLTAFLFAIALAVAGVGLAWGSPESS
ncbi:MAG: nitrate/nitrite transporter [Salinirussus sp.]